VLEDSVPYGVIATFSTPSRRFAEEVVGCGDVAERERVSDEGERIEAAGLDDADEPTHALLPARTQGRHHPFL